MQIFIINDVKQFFFCSESESELKVKTRKILIVAQAEPMTVPYTCVFGADDCHF